jgi:GNAT superfamily N-acetyltransferase
MPEIAACSASDFDRMLEIVNAAAEAYRGVIPDECFHDPYMPAAELSDEIAAGIEFSGCWQAGRLVGIMGIQNVADVTLIRHAYVDPTAQRAGIGAALLGHLQNKTDKPILIGTWKAAAWAIAFYEKHGFQRVGEDDIRPLLKRYWSVPDAQIANSCVLVESSRARIAPSS